jgi:hypothetical protein
MPPSISGLVTFQVGIVMGFQSKTRRCKSWGYVNVSYLLQSTTDKAKKQDSLSTPASTIRAAADATAKREIASQKEQYRHFGIMADWSAESTYRTRRTDLADTLLKASDPHYEMRQLRIFQKMVEKGAVFFLHSHLSAFN